MKCKRLLFAGSKDIDLSFVGLIADLPYLLKACDKLRCIRAACEQIRADRKTYSRDTASYPESDLQGRYKQAEEQWREGGSPRYPSRNSLFSRLQVFEAQVRLPIAQEALGLS